MIKASRFPEVSMNPLSLVSAPPIRSAPLAWTEARFYLFTALFAAGNLLVPLAVHSVPNAGAIFLPLFFFTLVAGWQFGFAAGLVVALASPLLNYGLVGMPVAAMLPLVLTKSVVLALSAAGLARVFKTVHLPGLGLSVVAMQGAGFVVERLMGLPVEKSLNLLTMAIPGMVILVVGGYVALRLTNRFLPLPRPPKK